MLRKLFRRLLPTPRKVREHRVLAWMGASLHHPRLWHVSREGIARGAAIGLFFGFLVPVGQIPLAAVVAFTMHANLPMAVVSTLVTNPFTFAPVYYFAYRIGLLLTGGESMSAIDGHTFDTDSKQLTGWFNLWSDRISQLGKPLFSGLITLACGSAALSYFGISWLWRLLTMREWRLRGSRNRTLNRATKE